MRNTTGKPGRPSAGPRPAARSDDRYRALIDRFPLRPIRNDADLDRASRVAGSLAVRSRLTAGERDYLSVLSDLIEKYEDARHPIPAGGDGAATLRFLLDENGLTLTELSRATGIALSTLSALAKGTRPFGLNHLRPLGEFFRVDPMLFVEDPAVG